MMRRAEEQLQLYITLIQLHKIYRYVIYTGCFQMIQKYKILAEVIYMLSMEIFNAEILCMVQYIIFRLCPVPYPRLTK